MGILCVGGSLRELAMKGNRKFGVLHISLFGKNIINRKHLYNNKIIQPKWRE